MNWPWPPLDRGDVAGILMVIAIVGILLFVFAEFPDAGRMSGFGPGWDCAFPGQGDPVCIKKAPAPSDKSH